MMKRNNLIMNSKKMLIANRSILISACITAACMLLGILLLILVSLGINIGKHILFLCALIMLASFVSIMCFAVREVRLIKRSLNKLHDSQVIARPLGSIGEAFHSLAVYFSDSERLKYEEQFLIKQAELDALQNQINPHFLYNTLDAIRGLAYSEEAEATAEMIESLSIHFRYATREIGKLVAWEEELENVRNYLKIQQYRFDNRFEFIENFEDEDQLRKCVLPSFTLQPLVENAINYAFIRKMDNCQIELSAMLSDKNFIIRVLDNGDGIPDQQLRELNDRLASGIYKTDNSKKGIALTNVNARIRLAFGEQYGIVVRSNPEIGTAVEIVLPIRKDYDEV